ncbi:iron-containing alcohol dehydrogenase [Brevundimonas sp. 2R-24]|uniref:Iron-containing alcohol dehydrogenase n=1 Tax=Peiella sedimenti TaxID=3061083 RepID=A0ABT8SIV7_9CAUL|nr:iron-containing alcohol dehydrogenase [Caulobacteraceae bacterium XZ-24]
MPYVCHPAPRLIVEDGGVSRLGDLAKELGGTRVLLVTDAGLVAAGLAARAEAALTGAGLPVAVFDGVEPDPSWGSIQRAVDLSQDEGCDLIVGFGGGSSMDTAKVVALARADRDVDAVMALNDDGGGRLAMIMVPTTAGTGSEVTPIAVVTTPTHEKVAVNHPIAVADIALLDAELTLGLPTRATAMTGIDAVVHAVEAYTTRLRKNPVSDALARQALRLLSGNLRQVLAEPGDVAARRAMLEGAMLAGLAFTNAPVGAVHALAYPLGGHFGVPHGLANALVFRQVLEFNAPACGHLYAELAADLPADLTGGDLSAEGFIRGIDRLLDALPLERRITLMGVAETDVPMMAADAMKIERILVNNARPMTHEAAESLYRSAL